jgi:hypothetical protein
MLIRKILPEIIFAFLTVGLISLILTIMPPVEFIVLFIGVSTFKLLNNFKPNK